jgi:FeS assembly protein SufD
MLSEPIPFAPSALTLTAALDELADLGASGGGVIDAATRRKALAAFANLGREQRAFPPRWRHDYAALAFGDLHWSSGRMRVPALPRNLARRDPENNTDLPALAIENAGGIVHVGSTYLQPASQLGDPRVTCSSLADARRRLPERGTLAQAHIVAPETDRFTALTTAFQNCGAYIDIPDGVILDAPIQLIWASGSEDGSAVFPITVIRVGTNVHATIVERHVGDAEVFFSGIVEIELAPNARLDYVVVQRADERSRILTHRAARCAEGATIGWHLAELGGTLVRSVVDAQLRAPRARAEIDAFFFAHGFAHADLTTDLTHGASETTSRTVVRSAASDRGHGRFTGSVHIPEHVHGCDASMRDDALVLSRDAYLDATPMLDIASNDVSASHAATVGSLDEGALFYVQSRGIARGTAERMMALAFFEPAIRGFPSDALRDEVRTALDTILDEVGDTFAT